MLRFFGYTLLSIVLTNWIYSELVLFFPETKTLCKNFFEVVRIPTHDEWPEIAAADTTALELGIESLFSHSEGSIFSFASLSRWEQHRNRYSGSPELVNTSSEVSYGGLVPIHFEQHTKYMQNFKGELLRF